MTILRAVWSDILHALGVSTAAKQRLIREEVAIMRRIAHPVFTVSAPFHDFLVR